LSTSQPAWIEYTVPEDWYNACCGSHLLHKASSGDVEGLVFFHTLLRKLNVPFLQSIKFIEEEVKR